MASLLKLPQPPLLSSGGVLVAEEDLRKLVFEVSDAILQARSVDGCYYESAGGLEFVRIDAKRALVLGLTIVDEEVML